MCDGLSTGSRTESRVATLGLRRRHLVSALGTRAAATSAWAETRNDARVRVLDRLEELYAIGGGVGANRVGGSEGEDRAHELAEDWMREAGLEVEVDAVGNLIGRTADAAVWTGSHLDSVPSGGKFDGALGVVAAIEAVERVGKGAAVGVGEQEAAFNGRPAV